VAGGRERKIDSLSSGERNGNSPNRVGVTACGRCRRGVVGLVLIVPQGGRGVTKRRASGRRWKPSPQRVKAPYAKARLLPGQEPEYDRARETRPEPAGTTP